MESLFLDLSEILRQQDQVVSSLLEAAREHNLALRNNNTEAILQAVQKQEKLLVSLQQQDNQREEIQQRLAGHYDLAQPVVLDKLLPYAASSTAVTLKRLFEHIKENAMHLGEINRLNSMLAKNGLVFTEKLKRILLLGNCSTYAGSGEMKKEVKPHSILNKTI